MKLTWYKRMFGKWELYISASDKVAVWYLRWGMDLYVVKEISDLKPLQIITPPKGCRKWVTCYTNRIQSEALKFEVLS